MFLNAASLVSLSAKGAFLHRRSAKAVAAGMTLSAYRVAGEEHLHSYCCWYIAREVGATNGGESYLHLGDGEAGVLAGYPQVAFHGQKPACGVCGAVDSRWVSRP